MCGSSESIFNYCGANPEYVNFVGNAPRGGASQDYGNTYNPSWRNHLNISQGGNLQNQHQQPSQYRPQGGDIDIINNDKKPKVSKASEDECRRCAKIDNGRLG